MAETISIDDVKKELKEWIASNKKVIGAKVYSDNIELNKHCKTLTKVKGKFPQFHAVITHLVQGFSAEWTELGKAEFKHKMLQNFHQKVNFPVIPAEILNSWLAELYVEGKEPREMPISQFIISDMLEKVIDDIDILSQTAEYDDTRLKEFGYSLDGIDVQVRKAVEDIKYPAFKIPLNAISSNNRIDEIKSFEKQLPKIVRKKIKKIFVSENFLIDYKEDYLAEYGKNTSYKDSDKEKSPLLKIEMVSLANISDSTIFATVDGNLVRLIDIFDQPEITDVQKENYLLKIFLEFWLGYDFLMNHLLFTAVFDGSKRGLGNEELNSLYYPAEELIVDPVIPY